MKITSAVIGQIDHNNIKKIHMDTENGAAVDLITYGAAVHRIFLPDQNGFVKNVVMSFQNWKDYERNPLYAGATLCPCAGRISRALLPLRERMLRLSANDGPNQLHGGFQNAAHRAWEVESLEEGADYCSASLTISLADGLDGYPGNRTVRIRYILRNPMSLELELEAVSDSATYFNLSNHSYFNLSGDFSRSGLDQKLVIYGNQYVANDSQHLPIRILPCPGTAFDFSSPVSLRAQMAAYPDDPQLANAAGYNNAFLLADYRPGRLKKAALLQDDTSGRCLSLYTDAPAVVLYSGGYIGSGSRLFPGLASSDSCALALEAQDVPDTPHFRPDPAYILRPGEVYRRRIIYAFGCQ